MSTFDTIDQASVPRAQATLGADLSIATSGTRQEIAWDAEAYDNDALHVTTGANEDFNITRDGLYMIVANINWAADVVGMREVEIESSVGPTVIARVEGDAVGATGSPAQSVIAFLEMKAGEKVSVFVTQVSGSALDILQVASSFSIIRIGS